MRLYRHRDRELVFRGYCERCNFGPCKGLCDGRGRPTKEIVIGELPKTGKFMPRPKLSDEQIVLSMAEYEAIRLIDFEGYSQRKAGESMNISRGTIWRLLDSGRKKIMRMIVEGKELIIEKITKEK